MRAVTDVTWHPYHGGAQGKKVTGDPNLPATRRWNAWFLRRFVWKKAVVLAPQVPPNTMYRIGFRNAWGDAFVLDHMTADTQYAMRIGHEDCAFFALHRSDGHEVPLRVVTVTRIDDMHYQDTPLY